MSIAYCRTEHMLVYFFTKYLQGELFVKFSGVIIWWKPLDTLHMRPSSTRERDGNVVTARPRKEVIDSNIDIKDKNMRRKRYYAYIIIHRNQIRHNVGTESSWDHLYINNNIHTNMCSSYDNVITCSQRNSSDMWDAVTAQFHTLSWTSNARRIKCLKRTKVTCDKEKITISL